MDPRRRRGIVTIIIAFVLTSVAGLWLALSSGDATLGVGGLLVRALLSFVVLTPIYLLGIYWYVQSVRGDLSVTATETELQRDLIDLIRVRRVLTIREAADTLRRDEGEIRRLVEELQRLEIFSGRVDWDTETLYADEGLLLTQ